MKLWWIFYWASSTCTLTYQTRFGSWWIILTPDSLFRNQVFHFYQDQLTYTVVASQRRLKSHCRGCDFFFFYGTSWDFVVVLTGKRGTNYTWTLPITDFCNPLGLTEHPWVHSWSVFSLPVLLGGTDKWEISLFVVDAAGFYLAFTLLKECSSMCLLKTIISLSLPSRSPLLLYPSPFSILYPHLMGCTDEDHRYFSCSLHYDSITVIPQADVQQDTWQSKSPCAIFSLPRVYSGWVLFGRQPRGGASVAARLGFVNGEAD